MVKKSEIMHRENEREREREREERVQTVIGNDCIPNFIRKYANLIFNLSYSR